MGAGSICNYQLTHCIKIDWRECQMSLGIIFKGPEGIVLAADSRVTINVTYHLPDGKMTVLPSAFDNATKLLRVNGQAHIGVVTFGLGALGNKEPRTAHSFISELEAEIGSNPRMAVSDFAQKFSDFFMVQWQKLGMPDPSVYQDEPMIFFVSGYDEGAAYGRVFEVVIPSRPTPAEKLQNDFGAIWGGQSDFVNRLLHGYDAKLPAVLGKHLEMDEEQMAHSDLLLRQSLSAQIPYQFLPLQDCVDLSIFLIRATINMQRWTIGIRGVGGAIDVATITKTTGYNAIQEKQVVGERV